MLVRKPNGDTVEVTTKAFELIYRDKGYTVENEGVKPGADLDDFTVTELKEKLDEAGIEYDAKDKKADLIALLEA